MQGAPTAWVEEAIQRFREKYSREKVFYVDYSAPPGLLVGGATIPYPFPVFSVTQRYLRRLRTSLVLVDTGVRPPRHFISSALDSEISIAYLDRLSLHPEGRANPQSNSGGAELAKVFSGLADRSIEDAMEIIASEMAREPRTDSNQKKRIKYFIWKHLVFRHYSRELRKLHSFAEIKTALGNPRSILCLGNGPSSEDPRLSLQDYDAVFRVNHRWLERGLFTSPSAIFTGALDSVRHVGNNILYVFINDERAMRIIQKVRKQISRLYFTNATDLGFPIEEFSPYQPTNGLVMLYVAINLRPDQLVIAGIDLYQDPRGCYPDMTSTPNMYTAAHSSDRELDLMLRLLASYCGSLTIIGEKLSFEYQRYVQEKHDKT